VHFLGLTNPSDGENEDWLACSSDLIVVLDGATVRTETGCSHGPAWFSRKLGAATIGHAASRSRALPDVLSDAIRDVAALHSDTCDLSDPAAPSAAAAIVRVEDDTIRYLVLGDVTIAAEVAGEVVAISDDRVSYTALEQRQEADSFLIGTPEKRAAMQRMKKGELAAKNTTGGYWIAGSDPSAPGHAVTGEWRISDVTRLAVMTDGAARLVNLFRRASWRGTLDLLKTGGPERLISDVRRIENADPDGQRYPRNKKSDDASVVYAVPELDISAVTPAPLAPEARRKLATDLLTATLNAPGVMGAEPVVPNWRPSIVKRSI
jgi:hypothetical protein